jgi:hypothetical protein
MNQQQRTAYAAPCFVAKECNNQRFFAVREGCSVAVTCNIGLE